MIFEHAWHDIFRRTTLSATPEEYDGSPSPNRFNLDWVHRSPISVDRMIVACALIFSNGVSGRLSFSSSNVPVSKPVADAIRLYFGEKQVELDNVLLRAREPEVGSAAFFLGKSGTYEPEVTHRGFDFPREVALINFPAHERAGSSFGNNRIEVASNAHMFERGYEITDIRAWQGQIATAVVLATEFAVGYVGLPKLVVRDQRFEATVELLKSVDLGILFTDSIEAH